jgi:hypothetical protein
VNPFSASRPSNRTAKRRRRWGPDNSISCRCSPDEVIVQAFANILVNEWPEPKNCDHSICNRPRCRMTGMGHNRPWRRVDADGSLSPVGFRARRMLLTAESGHKRKRRPRRRPALHAYSVSGLILCRPRGVGQGSAISCHTEIASVLTTSFKLLFAP